MKKKQIQKLMKQFRPSFEQVRLQLFDKIEQLAKQNHHLNIKVYIDPKKLKEMTIELLGETHKEQILSVPMDENFVTVLKRIQKQEKGLMDRFASNLASEVAGYWAPARQSQAPAEPSAAPVKPAEDKPAIEETVVEQPVAETTEAAETAEKSETSAMSYEEFTKQIEKFPKFFVEDADSIAVKEKGKEDRLLATISKTTVAEYTIEKALERKYKLKTEVIPLIQQFSETPLSER
ncbi:hypothetical protein [Enterococcus mediterraneensis]|uniref:hypothetical protein n=1 Tax=Enterococcus mediterraneensis TaxID=2364791 RepID=UPI000F0574CE|nr:hypothetical protein [Enterococcus mediterraneensis]